MAQGKDLVLVGRVVKTHGVKGQVKLAYFGEDLRQGCLYRELVIKDRAGKTRSYEVLQAVPQGPRILLKLKGIERVEDAETLVGQEVHVRRALLRDLSDGEHYWVDLLGMRVETVEGRQLGRLKEVFATGANDVFVVEGKKKEIYVPATDSVVRGIDRKKGVIEVCRMKGLWEAEDEV